MVLLEAEETSERPSDEGTSLGPSGGGPSSNPIEASLADLVVERAWLLKAEMRWVREDRNPLNAFRWFVWDRVGVGHPPSRAERATADAVTSATAASVPVRPNRRRLTAA